MTSMTGNRGPAGGNAGMNSAGAKQKAPPGYKQYQTQNFSPEQMQLFQQMFSNVGPDSYLSKLAGGDQSLFDEIEAPAMKQFQELQGQNASRFSGMGMGARKGSGFQNVQNQATSDFAQQLQSQRQGLQRQALMDLMNMSNNLLGQRPNENYLMPKERKQSVWQKILGGAAPLAGGAIGGYFGGPAGAYAGSQLGNAFGSTFSGGEQQPMNFSGIAGLPTSWGNSSGGAQNLNGAFGAQIS